MLPKAGVTAAGRGAIGCSVEVVSFGDMHLPTIRRKPRTPAIGKQPDFFVRELGASNPPPADDVSIWLCEIPLPGKPTVARAPCFPRFMVAPRGPRLVLIPLLLILSRTPGIKRIEFRNRQPTFALPHWQLEHRQPIMEIGQLLNVRNGPTRNSN